tara:strand:+ start:11761 stop:12258 length:498 start_codon:yes stop_codon:yes gene_type:complete
MITHSTIINYFKNIQTNLNGLEDFFRMDLSEIKGAFRSSANFPCMVAESFDIDFAKSQVNQSVTDKAFAFTIYYNPENENFDEQNTFLDLSEKMGYKVIARMKHDAADKTHFLFGRFKAETVRGHKVGPVFNERLYGYRFTGEITAPTPLIVDAADWEDIDAVCS